MFNYLTNKYSEAYFRIISRAQNRVVYKHWRKRHLNDQYYEEHHAHPTALGGLDVPENRVFLTAKEHFVCHLLLTKMLVGEELKSMQYTLHHMLKVPKKMQGLRYVPTGRTFEIARRAAADAARGNKDVAAKISASMNGRKLSEEHKRKIRAGMIGIVKSPEAAKASGDKQRGKPKSEASKEKMRLAWIARRERIAAGLETRKPMSEQGRKNISDAKKGKSITRSKPMSEQGRKNISDAKKGKKRKQSPFSEQAKQNIRDAAARRTGIPLTAEHRSSISAGLNTFYDRGGE